MKIKQTLILTIAAVGLTAALLPLSYAQPEEPQKDGVEEQQPLPNGPARFRHRGPAEDDRNGPPRRGRRGRGFRGGAGQGQDAGFVGRGMGRGRGAGQGMGRGMGRGRGAFGKQAGAGRRAGMGMGRGRAHEGALSSLLPAPHEVDRRIKTLHEELFAHQIFQLLNLSAEQKALLRAKLIEIRTTAKNIQDAQAESREKLVKTLEQIKAVYAEGKEPPAELLTNAKSIQEELHKGMVEGRAKLAEMVKEMQGSLTLPQWQRMKTFRPFQVIKQDSAANDQIPEYLSAMFLQKVREMPDPQFAHHTQRLTRRFERRQRRGQSIERDQLAKFVELLEKIRKLPQDEFEAKQEELAKALDPALMKLIAGRVRGVNQARRGQGPKSSIQILHKTMLSEAFLTLLGEAK